jgi:hypothetical protein
VRSQTARMPCSFFRMGVVVVWLWSSRRGLRGDVLVFLRLTWPALTATIMGFVIAMYVLPIVTHWLSSVTGDRSQVVRLMIRNRSRY